MKCKNTCIITGERTKELYDNFNKLGYDMNKHIPLKDELDLFEKSEKWGTGSYIKLEHAILEDNKLSLFFYSDDPIEQFWRFISLNYSLNITYSFFNENIGFIGVHTYSNGMLKTCEYDENNKSLEFKQLLNKANLDLFNSYSNNNSLIISFNELVAKNNE